MIFHLINGTLIGWNGCKLSSRRPSTRSYQGIARTPIPTFICQSNIMPLPFTDTTSSALLRGFDSITFDPLGVAAVLNNPRADLSAARLYVQSDRRAFRWPHTTMIGGEWESSSLNLFHPVTKFESATRCLKMSGRSRRSVWPAPFIV